ncbi:MAG: M60 family metallopeptidase, partial [Clostridia bacterium]|nr:M60 family metallopeptidase [Clostridia bacterium]
IVSRFQLDDKSKNVTIEGDKITAYVGSFLGGPIYVRPVKNNSGGGRFEQQLSVTISGGVRYQHFILGATTEEEYNLNKASTAPYFDLEIYDSVRFTTTKYASSSDKALKDYTYQDCTDSAILWDKISQVSKRVAGNGLSSGSSQVNIIGDCYVAAGAAFANPGRNGVVCPPGWLPSALDYDNFVNSGSWGTMHEYNHCWQGYGFGNGGEVSNNATTLISYSLYTRISSKRTMTGGLSDWTRYTDPAWAMQLLLPTTDKGNKVFDLSAYATLLHNIGQDSFVAAAKGGREAGSTIYFNNLVNATHYDMTYYFNKVLNYNIGGDKGAKGSITQDAVNAANAKNYPMFVPVSSVYQVGRSIIYDNEKKYITTAQPFSYGHGEYIMDFNNHNGNGTYSHKNLVIPDGFNVSVVSVTQPANGKVEMLDDNYVKYTPKNGDDGLCSGNFRVKLRIIKEDRAFIVEDVDLVINLKQSVGNQLYRTTYVYDTATAVPDTASIYNPQTKQFDFGSYASTERKINVCTQETNTQIWAAGRNYDDAVYNEKSTNYRLMPLNQTLQVLEGTMYFSTAGTYRITMKGRGKATLYLSFDNGDTWESAFTFDRTNTNNNQYVKNEFCERTLTVARSYVQFKVVLLVTKESDFFGIGTAKQNANGSFPDFGNAKASVQLEKFETKYRFKTEYKYSYTTV